MVCLSPLLALLAPLELIFLLNRLGFGLATFDLIENCILVFIVKLFLCRK